MLLKHSAKAFALFNLLLVTGCTGPGSTFPDAGTFRIDSDPPGASVYAMGENIGVTPLMISHKDVFPNVYPHEKESLYGKVTLRKEGCKDYTRIINIGISSYGLHARLDCSDMNTQSASTKNASGKSETVEQRLDKIKELRSKGLITEEEAKKAREHVLNDL